MCAAHYNYNSNYDNYDNYDSYEYLGNNNSMANIDYSNNTTQRASNFNSNQYTNNHSTQFSKKNEDFIENLIEDDYKNLNSLFETNTNKNFRNKLSEIKNKIYIIKQDIHDYFNEIEGRENRYKDPISKDKEKSDKKMNDIINQNKGIVKLNVGGEEYEVALTTLKSRRNTLFYKQILRGLIKANETVFYDRDSKYFPIILGFLRSGKISIKNLSEEEKEELLAEALFYETSYIVETLKNTQNNFFDFSEVKITKPFTFEGKIVGESFCTNLLNKKLDKGFICDKDGEIMIKFNKDIIAVEMKIAGYNGNNTAWFVGNGKGARIFTAMNATGNCESVKTWNYLTTIPDDFGHNITTISFQRQVFRFMKIQSTDYFGIGFLDFKIVS